MNPLFWILYIFVLTAAVGALSAAPWVPTRKGQRELIAKETEIPPGAALCDLGCGDGTVLFDIARRRSDVRAVGYDISLFPLLIGWVRKLAGGKRYRNVSLRFADLFRADISRADVVFVFLLPKSYPRLMAKLSAEAKDGCLVVLEAWPFEGVTPLRTVRVEGLLPMFYYEARQLRDAMRITGGART